MTRTPASKAASLRESALEYASAGWPVLPLVPQKKQPLTERGLLDASTDIHLVSAWWKLWPFANIGLRTGLLFDVFDVDGPVGRAGLQEAAGSGYRHPGPVSSTGKGWHLFIQPTQSVNKAGMLPKLDFRGVNGYVVAPPSIHPDGQTYVWQPDRDWHTPLPVAPDWMLKMLTPFEEKVRTKPIIANPYDTMNDIVQAAEDMGYMPRKRGSLYKFRCPYHDGDNEASFTLYPATSSFYCFGCGAWGDAMDIRNGAFRRNA